jgi:DeoR family fructose operon transcriptional repressor
MMRADERRERILAQVLAGNGHVAELAERLDASHATIRRDLQRLEEEGRITRTYGGAVASPRPIELTLHEKELSHPRHKDAIARMAAALVQEGDVVVLDAGTTTGRLAWHLRERAGITVVTNGVSALMALRDADQVEVIVLGGTLRHRNQAIIGSTAEDTLRRIRADKVFLGADGVVAGEGLNTPTDVQAHLKGVMLHQAREAYLLVDHSKLGARRFAYLTPLDSDCTIITDTGASPSQLQEFERRRIPVLLAEVG